MKDTIHTIEKALCHELDSYAERIRGGKLAFTHSDIETLEGITDTLLDLKVLCLIEEHKEMHGHDGLGAGKHPRLGVALPRQFYGHEHDEHANPGKHRHNPDERGAGAWPSTETQ